MTTTPPARYDAIADWYVEFSRNWGVGTLALVPDDLRGKEVLDLACGHGMASRFLAERGASVTGLDLSTRMIALAQKMEADQRLGIRYVQGDATRTDWWDGRRYDGVVCNMALMDIDDLDGALATTAAVLEPGGWFTFSVFHPCYPGGPEGSLSGLPSWPPDQGYAWEGLWSTRDAGVRGRAGVNHRMLSTYLNAVVGAGFVIEHFAEKGMSVPVVLAAFCRRR